MMRNVVRRMVQANRKTGTPAPLQRMYHDHHARSLTHKEEWWSEIAKEIDWFEVRTCLRANLLINEMGLLC